MSYQIRYYYVYWRLFTRRDAVTLTALRPCLSRHRLVDCEAVGQVNFLVFES